MTATVTETTPVVVGGNLIVDGSFEAATTYDIRYEPATNVSKWYYATDREGVEIDNSRAHSGTKSLHIRSNTQYAQVYTTCFPTNPNNNKYRISFWGITACTTAAMFGVSLLAYYSDGTNSWIGWKSLNTSHDWRYEESAQLTTNEAKTIEYLVVRVILSADPGDEVVEAWFDDIQLIEEFDNLSDDGLGRWSNNEESADLITETTTGWTVGGTGTYSLTQETGDKQRGYASIKLTCTGAGTLGLYYYFDPDIMLIEQYTQVKFWLKSNKAIDFVIRMPDSANSYSTSSIASTGGVWTEKTIDFSSMTPAGAAREPVVGFNFWLSTCAVDDYIQIDSFRFRNSLIGEDFDDDVSVTISQDIPVLAELQIRGRPRYPVRTYQLTDNGTIPLNLSGDAESQREDWVQEFTPFNKLVRGITVRPASNTGSPTNDVVFKIVIFDNTTDDTVDAVLMTHTVTATEWDMHIGRELFVPLQAHCNVDDLTSDQVFGIMIEPAGSTFGGTYRNLTASTTDAYAGHSMWWYQSVSPGWTEDTTKDLYFKIHYRIAGSIKIRSTSGTEFSVGGDILTDQEIWVGPHGRGMMIYRDDYSTYKFYDDMYEKDSGIVLDLPGSTQVQIPDEEGYVYKFSCFFPIIKCTLWLNTSQGNMDNLEFRVSSDGENWSLPITDWELFSTYHAEMVLPVEGTTEFYLKIYNTHATTHYYSYGMNVYAQLDTSRARIPMLLKGTNYIWQPYTAGWMRYWLKVKAIENIPSKNFLGIDPYGLPSDYTFNTPKMRVPFRTQFENMIASIKRVSSVKVLKQQVLGGKRQIRTGTHKARTYMIDLSYVTRDERQVVEKWQEEGTRLLLGTPNEIVPVVILRIELDERHETRCTLRALELI